MGENNKLEVTERIKPCPFCGSECAVVAENWPEFYVKCNGEKTTTVSLGLVCEARGPIREIKEEAIAAWNKRKDEERIENLKALFVGQMDEIIGACDLTETENAGQEG